MHQRWTPHPELLTSRIGVDITSYPSKLLTSRTDIDITPAPTSSSPPALASPFASSELLTFCPAFGAPLRIRAPTSTHSHGVNHRVCAPPSHWSPDLCSSSSAVLLTEHTLYCHDHRRRGLTWQRSHGHPPVEVRLPAGAACCRAVVAVPVQAAWLLTGQNKPHPLWQ